MTVSGSAGEADTPRRLPPALCSFFFFFFFLIERLRVVSLSGPEASLVPQASLALRMCGLRF